ncbi:hypothetical protein KEM60_02281 [Austwickia sp. TVS 96-490-7B]|uniref:ABC transporter substrate-binding protein n=1 Tax=Austwickia sp. TVS 96-490-7B TaxID=2830843 RepID=UPI001C55A3E6|nr:ABC transporter substrate-binding protein [Austwickia sp. TVS 96-490-7B]MBW3086070.1 hypothetical protein [Austwickia sp. TVS 96-490-7B]
MTRPSSEAEYLGSLIPASLAATPTSRRSLLKGAFAAGALLAAPPLLTACGDGGSGSGTGTVKFGSNQSDAVPKAAISDVIAAFKKANPDIDVAINTIDHNTFQENINNYLQGSPDDAFTWFSGYRMRFFAQKGLIGDLSDLWKDLPGYSDTIKKACTGDDGKQYLVPGMYYPWAMHYRKSVFADKGYDIPKTFDDLIALCAKMKKDGMEPIAFADKDGWPAMGTFDILNLRINGFEFHVNLMAGKEDWSGSKVKKVFEQWKRILPHHQPDSLGRTWQEAAKSLYQKQTGLYYLGTFVAQQFPKGAEQEDLDFFNFPEIDSTIGTDAIDAPVDGYMMARRPRNEAGAKKLLKFWASPEAHRVLATADASMISTNEKTDTSVYVPLQKRQMEFVTKAKSLAQFLDRDSRPDFASTVITPALQSFIKTPDDVDSILSKVEAQKKTIFTA